jgi:hypothetical protein
MLNAQFLRLVAAATLARNGAVSSTPEKQTPLRGKRRGARRPRSVR